MADFTEIRARSKLGHEILLRVSGRGVVEFHGIWHVDELDDLVSEYVVPMHAALCNRLKKKVESDG